MYIYIDPNFQITGDTGGLRLKRGDSFALSICFINSAGKIDLPDVSSIFFGVKPKGNYTGDFLAYADTFRPNATSGGRPCMEGSLKLNSQALSDLIGNQEYLDTICELEFSFPGGKRTTQTLPLRIDNDVIKNTEGLVSLPAPEYVTKDYVDSTVERSVSNSMEEQILLLENLKNESVDAARLSESSANQASLQLSTIYDQVRYVEEISRNVENNKITCEEAKVFTENSVNRVNEVLPIIENAVEETAAAAEQAVMGATQSSKFADTATLSSQIASQHASTAITQAQQAGAFANTAGQYKDQSQTILEQVIEHRDNTKLSSEEAENHKNAAIAASNIAQEYETSAWAAARQAAATTNTEGIFSEIEFQLASHNETETAHAKSFSQKLDITTAEETYATKEEMALKLPLTTALETFATKDALNQGMEERLLASEVQALFLNSAPPGSVIFYAAATPPDGWLECNGATLSKVSYDALYAAIGTIFGEPDLDSFNVPDLRGYYISCWDHGAERDTGRLFGSYQADALQRVQGQAGYVISTPGTSSKAYGALKWASVSNSTAMATTSTTASNPAADGLMFDNSLVARTANKTRPENIALLPIIKY